MQRDLAEGNQNISPTGGSRIDLTGAYDGSGSDLVWLNLDIHSALLQNTESGGSGGENPRPFAGMIRIRFKGFIAVG